MSSPARNNTPTISTLGDTSNVAEEVSIVKILDYMRSTFSEESVLDSLPLESAANPGAYHAWRTYRAPILQAQHLPAASVDSAPLHEQIGEAGTLGRNRRPGEWNWEGVWEERVKKAVRASLSESVLFGVEDIVSLCMSLAVDAITDACRSASETVMKKAQRR